MTALIVLKVAAILPPATLAPPMSELREAPQGCHIPGDRALLIAANARDSSDHGSGPPQKWIYLVRQDYSSGDTVNKRLRQRLRLCGSGANRMLPWLGQDACPGQVA
jgi:hypothetical protein